MDEEAANKDVVEEEEEEEGVVGVDGDAEMRNTSPNVPEPILLMRSCLVRASSQDSNGRIAFGEMAEQVRRGARWPVCFESEVDDFEATD